MKVQTILGDNRCEYCGRPDKAPPANSFLQLEQIEHRTTKVGKPRSNGFRERFHPDAPIKSISKSRAGPPDLGTYNTRRPHRCRGMESRTPYEV